VIHFAHLYPPLILPAGWEEAYYLPLAVHSLVFSVLLNKHSHSTIPGCPVSSCVLYLHLICLVPALFDRYSLRVLHFWANFLNSYCLTNHFIVQVLLFVGDYFQLPSLLKHSAGGRFCVFAVLGSVFFSVVIPLFWILGVNPAIHSRGAFLE